MWRVKRISEWTSSSSSGEKRKNRNDGFEDDIPGAYDPSNKDIEYQDGPSGELDEPNAKRTRRDEPTNDRASHFARQKYIRIENTEALPESDTRQSVQRPLPPSNIPRSSTSTTRAVPPPGKPTDPDELRTCNALTSAEHQVASHKSQMNSLHMQLSTRTSELHQHASKAEMLEKKLQETKVLLEARTVELCAAQAFVTTADSMSVAEVTRFVEKLNDEVYQVAVDLGNTVLKHRLPENCLRRACFWEVVVKVWGDAVVDRLHADIQKEDTLLFEALAQNTVLAFCLAVVRSLCDWNAQVDEEIRLVWDEIRKSTDLAVAKNWLALTKHSSPRSFNRFGCTMDLMELMAFAGVPLDVLMDSAKQTIGAKISLILSKALKIREMVNAGVLSAHVELILQLRL